MTLSVNTNTGSLIALQYLNQTNAQLEQVQNQINSGLKVSSAKDDGATFAIAQNQRGDLASYGAVTDSINRATSAVDVANSAGQSISDLLIQLKAKALAASDSSLDTASRQSINEDFTSLRDQITSIVQNATFNGVNLIDGSKTNGISALASADGTHKITIASENLSLGGSIVTLASTASVSTQAKASTLVSTIETSLNNVDSALSKLGSGSKKLSIQGTFVQNLSDTVTTGIGNLVDADLASDSAKLTSLQTKQQLGVQALSIANQAPSIVLSLFH
jgi:flagellin